MTHAVFQGGRDATVFRKRREGGVPKAAPAAGAASAETEGGGRAR